MDYRLQVFWRVAEEQSISAAAKALNISQPAVTQHIKILEESFSVTFFVRSRTGVALTEAGIILLDHVHCIAALDEEVTAKLHHAERTLKGKLRLGASTTIMQYYLPPFLAAFKRKYPEVSIEILENNSTGVISALLAQRIELGFIEAPCRRRDLRSEPFFEDEIVVIASPHHPLASKAIISKKEFAQQSFVFRELGSGTRQCVEESFQRLKINTKKLSIIQELSSTEAIKRVVAEGMGIGFVSRLSITQELATGSLVLLNIDDVAIHRPFSTILALGSDPIGLRQIFLTALRSVSSQPLKKTL